MTTELTGRGTDDDLALALAELARRVAALPAARRVHAEAEIAGIIARYQLSLSRDVTTDTLPQAPAQ